jgi:hypothetical protein
VLLGGLQWQKVGRLQLAHMLQSVADLHRYSWDTLSAIRENEPERIAMLLSTYGYTRILSKEQISIIRARAAGDSYAKIRADFKLCNEEAVARCLTRTVLGFNWTHKDQGGRPSYLSDAGLAKFDTTVADRSRAINCITKSEARSLAFEIRQDTIRKGISILTQIHSDKLIARLQDMYDLQEPDGNTIRTICEQLNLNICQPQHLELARRMFCDRPRVENFFAQFAGLFDRDPRLIWNADETQLCARKRFKVICRHGELPLVTAMQQVPHITGLVSISGGGKVLPPIVILKDLQNLRQLTERESECYFATSLNGWITKDIWVYFAIVFCAQMSEYRLKLPPHLRAAQILLIIDGHKSRISVLAAAIFIVNNIAVLVFPAHTTHLLQMYDVGVAPALKVAFKDELDKRVKDIQEAPRGEKIQAMRIALVDSFINAVHRGATPSNIKSGFRSSGVSPLNPDKPLSSQFAVEPPPEGLYQRVDTGAEINDMVLTDPAGLEKLSQIQYKRSFDPAMGEVNYRQIWEQLLRKTVTEGRPITAPPPFYIRDPGDPSLIREIHIPSLPA